MKEVTLKLPDKKLAFFLDLIKQLGFEVSAETEIPKEHKTKVRDRIETTKPEEMVFWK